MSFSSSLLLCCVTGLRRRFEQASSPALARENPVSEVLHLGRILRLDDLVILFVPIGELGLFATREVVNDSLLRIGLALVFRRDFLESRAVLFLIDAVALEAVVLPRQRLRRIVIDGTGGRSAQEQGERQQRTGSGKKGFE